MTIKQFCVGSLLICTAAVCNAQQPLKWTLEDCVSYAWTHNISVKQSELDVQSAQIEKSAGFGAFLPSVNANSSHSWNVGLNQNITTNLLENQTTQFTSLGANVGVDIYKGLQNQLRFRKSKLAILAAQYQLAKMKDDIGLNVANAFLQILFNKESLKVQKDQLSISEKQLQRTQEFVDAGVLPRGDVLDSKATVASDKQKVVVAENALLISKLSLAQLLQLDNFQEFDIVDADYQAIQSEVMFQSPSAIIAKAKENRVELKLAKTNMEVADKDISIARSAYQPTIQGFYGFNSRISYADIPLFDASGNLIGTRGPLPFSQQFNNNKGHQFGLQLSVPIFNGFTVKYNVKRAKVALERSKIAYAQSELDLERTIYSAYTDAQGAYKAYESALTARDARSTALDYAKERFDVGLMNTFEYNQAQTLYVNAQSEVLRTKYDYIFRTKIVEFYFGLPIQLKP
ncbi:MAG: TolC family protein [Flavobacterium sp.]|nr:TolC family protein [Flavobacterium sp.]